MKISIMLVILALVIVQTCRAQFNGVMAAFDYRPVPIPSGPHFDPLPKEGWCSILGMHLIGTPRFEAGAGWFENRQPKAGAWGIGGAVEIRLGTPFFGAAGASAWYTWRGLMTGANFFYGTNLDHGSISIRPEIGLGIPELRLVYGYTIVLYGNSDAERHEVAVRVLVLW